MFALIEFAAKFHYSIIKGVSQNSPAQKAGLKVGDIILKVNDVQIKSPDQLTSVTKKHLGEKVTLEINRCEKQISSICQRRDCAQSLLPPCGIIQISLTPREHVPKNEGAMGVSISNLEEKKYSWYKAPFFGNFGSLFDFGDDG